MWEQLKDFTMRILMICALLDIILQVSIKSDQRELAWIEGFAIFLAVIISTTVGSVNDF
jgi:quinol-cytochrome oxidoreductase complex cytochrome b subunit